MESTNFTHCPRCKSVNIEDTDYETENDEGEIEIDENGIACADCGWEGNAEELVCKPREGR